MNFYESLRKDKVFKLKEFIDKLIPVETWANNIILPYIAGKLCYNKDFNVRDFEYHNEGVYSFLRKLSGNAHLSVFEHDVTIVDLVRYCALTPNFHFTIKELFSYIIDEEKFYEFLSEAETNFPTWHEVAEHNTMTTNVFCDFMNMIVGSMLVGSARCGGEFSINLRSYLEMCKVLGCEDEFWQQIQAFEVSPPDIVDSIELKNGGILHIIRLEDGQIPVVSYLVEGGSIVLEKQTIRHRLQSSFSVSSFRYNNAEDCQFVMPFTRYEEKLKKDAYREVVDMYAMVCESALEVYKNLIERGIKKEDARFILPVGLCTNIMVTMLDLGLGNFLELRTNENEAQWEICEIANIIKQKLDCSNEIVCNEEGSNDVEDVNEGN